MANVNPRMHKVTLGAATFIPSPQPSSEAREGGAVVALYVQLPGEQHDDAC